MCANNVHRNTGEKLRYRDGTVPPVKMKITQQFRVPPAGGYEDHRNKLALRVLCASAMRVYMLLEPCRVLDENMQHRVLNLYCGLRTEFVCV